MICLFNCEIYTKFTNFIPLKNKKNVYCDIEGHAQEFICLYELYLSCTFELYYLKIANY